MAVLAQQTIVGTVGSVYDLRTVGAKETPVVEFSVAVTPSRKDGDKWVDGETYWINVTVWNRQAKHVSASLKKGDRVMVIGRTQMKEGYTNKDGIEVAARPILIADHVGIELSFTDASSDRKVSSDGESRPAQKEAAPKKEEAPAEDIFADDDFDFEDDDAPF